MNYAIKDASLLKKILWIDAFLGGITAVAGLCLSNALVGITGLTAQFILVVSAITLCYSAVACWLATQRRTSVSLLRTLIAANWIWTGISTVLLLIHFGEAQPVGKAFLVLQIPVVGGLAYLEGKQLIHNAAEQE